MEMNVSLVYRKTERGQGEIKSRAGGLSVRARTLLILTNAVDSVATLHKKMGADAASVLHDLAAQGYIEPIEATKPKVSASPTLMPTPRPALMPTPVAMSVPSVPSVTSLAAPFAETLASPLRVDLPDTPVLSQAEFAARLAPLRRAALKQLTPHFGPDVVVVAQPLLKAQTPQTYNAALDLLASKLAIYLGRKKAALVVDGLRP